MKSSRPGVLAPLALVLLLTPALAGDFMKDISGNWIVATPGDKEAAEPTASDYHDSILTVTAEDYDNVTYTLVVREKKTTQRYPSGKVAQIFYEPHQGYVRAAQAMGGGRWDEALQLFDGLAKGRSNRFWVQMYSLINMAKIYGAQGRWQEQVQTYERLVKAFPQTRYVDEAYVNMGKAFLRLGNGAEAEQSFRRLERVAGLPEGKKALARYWLIFIKQDAGQIDVALGEYRRLLSEVENDAELEEVAVLARLGIGTCMVLKGDYGDALEFFRKIADSSEDPAVLSGAFNGLGQCYYKQNKWQEALTAFLRTVVLYEENPDHTSMALYHAAKCFQFLAPENEGYATRARELYRECIQRYGSTQWGQESRRELPGVRGK